MKPLYLTIVASVVMAMAWLYPWAGPLNTIGWVILLFQVTPQSRRKAAGLGLLSGTIQVVIAFHWVPFSVYETTNLGVIGSIIAFVGFVLWEASVYSMFCLAAAWLGSSQRSKFWLLVPIWVSLETVWPKIFPWSIAHTYLDYGPVVQVAQLAGTAGVAALLMILNLLLFNLLRTVFHHRLPGGQFRWSVWGDTILASGAFVGIVGWGVYRIEQVHHGDGLGKPLRVAVVQVDPTIEGSTERMRELSDSVGSNIDLYVWPESALGIYHSSLTDFRNELRTVELSEAPNPAVDPYPQNPSQLLAGGKTYDDGGRNRGPYRNDAFLIDFRKDIIGRTSKRTLMPIGEYVPMGTWVPWFRDLAAVNTDLIRGTDDTPMALANGVKIGVTVCYEDMDANVSASTVGQGAEILFGLINASAFVDPTTLQQHLRLAQLRAVENQRWFIRCSATGVSCAVDPTGRVVQSLPVNEDGVLVAEVFARQEKTFFTCHPRLFADLMLFTVILNAAMASLMMLVRFPTLSSEPDFLPESSMVQLSADHGEST